MRIGIAVHAYSLVKGGAERHCVTLARRFMQLGHEVLIAASHWDAELGGEACFLPVAVESSSSWSRTRSFYENAGQALASRPLDVTFAMGRVSGVDVLHVISRVHAHWMEVRYPGLVQRALQRLNPRHLAALRVERDSLTHTPWIVVQSELDRRLVVEHYGIPQQRIRLVRNGVDTAVFNLAARSAADDVKRELGVPRHAPLLVFASAIDFKNKGLPATLAALALMRNRDVFLAVVGGAAWRPFSRSAWRLGIDRRVIFGGRQSRMERILGAADLLVLPTPYEPFPNVILEAMATGTPVLTTRTNGGAEVVDEGRTGYTVSSVTAIDEMAERMDAHFELGESRRRWMSQACWEKARHLTYDRHAAALISVLGLAATERAARAA